MNEPAPKKTTGRSEISTQPSRVSVENETVVHETGGDAITSADLGGSSRRHPVLILLEGSRVSERHVLEAGETVMGRDPGSTGMRIQDNEASRRHCVLKVEFPDNPEADPTCTLIDNKSTNGTFVNSRRIDAPKVLNDGDLIRIGRTTMGFFLKDQRLLELDQLLVKMALYDSLTGLTKRDVFFNELHREFDRSVRHRRALSLGMLDLDHFKVVNDVHGHLVGDNALRHIAAIMDRILREADVCGRYGGEEFAVLLPETDPVGAMRAMERVRKAVESEPLALADGGTVPMTISIGVATLKPHHVNKMDLLEEADKALLYAKRTGRNRVVAFEDILADPDSTTKKG